jgi:glutamate-1-semialdehyde aminotransferase
LASDEQTTGGLTSEQVVQMITPTHVVGGRGGYLFDRDSNLYLDMVSAWGANLLGYGYRRVTHGI